MTAIKKRIIPYLVFILLGGICVFFSGLIAGFAAYQAAMGPPSGVGKLLMSLEHSRIEEVKALLLREKEGKFITEDEFIEFLRDEPRTESGRGDFSESKSDLCFATRIWALRVYFDEKGIFMAYELKWDNLTSP